MKVEIFHKDKTKLKIKPNLEDYQKTAKEFKWTDAKDELTWFEDGKINAAFNAVDRHADSWRKNKVALLWEDEDGATKQYSFLQLKEYSNQIANVLRDLGVDRGDRVFIFLPRVVELYVCFLGILKTGAIAGTLFQAFGPSGIEDRLGNSDAKIVITNKELKERIYAVKKNLPALKKIIVIDAPAGQSCEVSLAEKLKEAPVEFEVRHMDPEDPAFMLYTSGTTGKPKGVVHAHLAILQEHMTAKWVLDMHDEDIYWCTADPGWVTGIAYEILGSWSNGVTSVVYAGRFDPERWYQIIDKYKVTIWYTAPTAVRMLMKTGEKLVKKYDLSTLRHLCSVGEPLNPEAIRWGLRAFGLPFHDNWWQTETGAMMIANYPSVDIKIGSMGRPVPGIIAGIIDDKGEQLPVLKEGNLAIKPGWPSMMRTIWRRHAKYDSYFITGRDGEWYISGDRAYRDKDGYFWFLGRADDVIKTAGERVGPFEVESALVEHPAIAEAGVIGKPDPERGEIIKAFVILKSTKFEPSKHLEEEISQFVKTRLAGHAYPKEVEFVKTLPKTRSGKIMRRVLKARELGLPVGDVSTLEEY